LVLGVVALLLGLLVPGAVLIVASAAVLLCGLLWCSPARCVAALGGRDAREPVDARLINLVEGLCVAIGLPVPRLIVLDDPAANAIVLGTSPAHATLVCTSGALRLLDRMELEGLVAHELAHLKRGDTRASAMAMIFLGALALVAPHPGRLLRRVGDPAREAEADLFGTEITRYPPGLRQALEKLAAAPITRPAALSPRLFRLTGTFWCVPLERDGGTPLVAGVLDLELRVSALSEL
jgi:heat shock protein HtpX